MSYLPCENPNCKSYGRPHPNCRCHGDGAAGGMVERFCASGRTHTPECEYFAEGGEVDPAQVEVDIPAAEVVPDEPEIPADEVEVDLAPGREIPAAEVVVDKPEHGTTTGALGTAIGEGIPILGPLATKGARAVAAGLNQVTPDSLLAPDWRGKSFSEVYNQLSGAAEAQAADHPTATAVGDILGGVTAFGPADKVAATAAKAARLGKVGSGFLRGAISNGLIAGSDEASKMLLGQDPEAPVATVLASAGLGAVFGGFGAAASSLASKGLQKITEGKFGDRATSWLAGLGAGADPANKGMGELVKEMEKIPGFSAKDFKEGIKAFGEIASRLAGPATTGSAFLYGLHEDGLEGGLKYGAGMFGARKGLNVLGKLAGKVSAPVVLKLLSSDTTLGMLDALNHADRVNKGIKAVDAAVNGLFTGSAKVGTKVMGADSKKLEDWLENGGIDNDVQDAVYESQAAPQGFAEGGEVAPAAPRQENGVAIHFPEQNVVMQAAKARAAGYLNSLRPSKHAPRLAFDDAPDDRQQKKTYKRALAVANQPLRVLDEIKRGTIEPDDIKHLTQMFPEVVGLLQKKLTERVSEAQLTGKRPSSRVRQGLSMLMGTALSSEFTPQSIQAAQAVFAQKSQSQSTPPPSKGDRSKLSHSDRSYLTDDQARMQRQQRQT
jgi:hypothetical protein